MCWKFSNFIILAININISVILTWLIMATTTKKFKIIMSSFHNVVELFFELIPNYPSYWVCIFHAPNVGFNTRLIWMQNSSFFWDATSLYGGKWISPIHRFDLSQIVSTFAIFVLVKKNLTLLMNIKVESSIMFVQNSFIDVSFIDKQTPLNTYLSWGWYVIACTAQINFINTFWCLVYFFQLWYKCERDLLKKICFKFFSSIFFSIQNNENFPPQFFF
jgi:hypothetical protein